MMKDHQGLGGVPLHKEGPLGTEGHMGILLQIQTAMYAFLSLIFPVRSKLMSQNKSNGPDYSSKAFQSFRKEWQIKHISGIPYPQGQAIVEHA